MSATPEQLPRVTKEPAYTSDEMMAITGARQIKDGQSCFVGIGLPGTAAVLAKHLHAPRCVLVYESGVFDTAPARAPLSIGDGSLVDSARMIVPMAEMFNYWLQGGWIDLGFLGAAQIDRFGNINTTVIGDYDRPTVRLPGAGGAPEIASLAGEIVVITRHDTRSLVATVDFITSVGHLDGSDARGRLGLRGRGPTTIVTDLGILRSNPESHEFELTGVYPGIDPQRAQERTGWDLKIASDLEEIDGPSQDELETLRSIA